MGGAEAGHGGAGGQVGGVGGWVLIAGFCWARGWVGGSLLWVFSAFYSGGSAKKLNPPADYWSTTQKLLESSNNTVKRYMEKSHNTSNFGIPVHQLSHHTHTDTTNEQCTI